MHVRQRLLSHPSAFAVHSPIFPGEYSQFCPSFVHVLVGFCGEASFESPVGGQPATQSKMIASRTVLFTSRT
jgi:hypothetical protein